MAKWYVGVALAGCVIGIMFFSMQQPWFKVEEATLANPTTAELTNDTTEADLIKNYHLKKFKYEVDAPTGSEVGVLDGVEVTYEEMGWDGNYEEGGREAKHEVFQTSYYMVLLTMVMAVLAAVTIPIAGLGYLTAIVPKLFCVFMIIFSILGPIYFAVFLPGAFEEDQEKLCPLSPESFSENPLIPDVRSQYDEQNDIWECPKSREAEGFMASEEDDKGKTLAKWGPAFGWWMAVISIFLGMFAFVCAEGKKKAPPLPEPAGGPDEYADPYDNRYGGPDPYGGAGPRGPGYGGPPPRGPPGGGYDGYGGDPYHDDPYGGGPPRGGGGGYGEPYGGPPGGGGGGYGEPYGGPPGGRRGPPPGRYDY